MSDALVGDGGWHGILRTLLVAVLSYAALILMLRTTGKRTLSKLNAFDLIVTVALGSTLASVITSRDVSLLTGVVAFAALVGLQFAITWASVRSRRVGALVKSEPRLLAYRGELLPDAMRHERVTVEELHAAMRGSGIADLARVERVVLETDGSLSVVGRRAGAGADDP